MLYPQNGDRIVATDSVTSFHPVYCHCLHSMRSRVYEMAQCPSVFLSVPASAHSSNPAVVGLLPAACGPGGQEISIDCCCSSGRMRAVPGCQRTLVAEHRLVIVRVTLLSCELHILCVSASPCYVINFYRATLSPSACLSQAGICVKMAEHRPTQTTLRDSSGTLLF